MNWRATLDHFSWEVSDDERPIPLSDEASLATVDDLPAPSGSDAVTSSGQFVERSREISFMAVEAGWSSRFTAAVAMTCCLAFGVGWTWRGSRPPADVPERRNSVSSTNGNAAPQEWKEHRDD